MRTKITAAVLAGAIAFAGLAPIAAEAAPTTTITSGATRDTIYPDNIARLNNANSKRTFTVPNGTDTINLYIGNSRIFGEDMVVTTNEHTITKVASTNAFDVIGVSQVGGILAIRTNNNFTGTIKNAITVRVSDSRGMIPTATYSIDLNIQPQTQIGRIEIPSWNIDVNAGRTNTIQNYVTLKDTNGRTITPSKFQIGGPYTSAYYRRLQVDDKGTITITPEAKLGEIPEKYRPTLQIYYDNNARVVNVPLNFVIKQPQVNLRRVTLSGARYEAYTNSTVSYANTFTFYDDKNKAIPVTKYQLLSPANNAYYTNARVDARTGKVTLNTTSRAGNTEIKIRAYYNDNRQYNDVTLKLNTKHQPLNQNNTVTVPHPNNLQARKLRTTTFKMNFRWSREAPVRYELVDPPAYITIDARTGDLTMRPFLITDSKQHSQRLKVTFRDGTSSYFDVKYYVR